MERCTLEKAAYSSHSRASVISNPTKNNKLARTLKSSSRLVSPFMTPFFFLLPHSSRKYISQIRATHRLTKLAPPPPRSRKKATVLEREDAVVVALNATGGKKKEEKFKTKRAVKVKRNAKTRESLSLSAGHLRLCRTLENLIFLSRCSCVLVHCGLNSLG